MAAALYLDTSAVLRAVLESGTTPDLKDRILSARTLITSRLSQVESSRALLRLRRLSSVSEVALTDAGRQIDALWTRCALWELTPVVCEMARQVAPYKSLRTLDALHLATFLLARRKIGDLELVSVDERLLDAVGGS